uniref:Peptidyl-prolyl cis-trans isomerase n=2 Tax=Eukaryota TaxID=2759 RepID=A0A7S2Z539_9CHLO|mmetsp:Transcript_594/g.1435  ORF Transcript_594/g.1435 Transcript_594/m.1435 type:complete len:175 (+) Transcript_594:19-543(+)
MEDPELPSGWRKKQSKSRPGVWYYIDLSTGETQWEKPTKRSLGGEHEEGGKKQRRADDGGEVRVLHLLKKHRDSRRPASWRNPDITITKEEATQLVETLRAEIVAAKGDMREAFESRAKVESDCSSAKRGGDLGFFGKGKMMPSFERASFELKPGDLSDLVETDSGVHIIYRVA